MKKTVIPLFLLAIFLTDFNLFADAGNASGIYKNPDSFVKSAFQQNPPKAKVIWIKGKLKNKVKEILGHQYAKLRIKYWKKGARSVWVLDEIGKEKPITSGIVVNNHQIEKVEVLAFCESRGWEVKYPFFTNQFIRVALKSLTDTRLDKNIDGITGATLSVNALKAQARMALYLDQYVSQKK